VIRLARAGTLTCDRSPVRTASAATYDASDYRADQQLRILMHRTGETR
jgi:hypothetical protein